MLGFGESFLAWTAATFLPALAALTVIVGANKFVGGRYLSAFALGIFLWFFVDTISGSATLDVNSGFDGGSAQVAVVILFVVGVLIFFLIDRNRNIFSAESAIGKYGMIIPFLVAAAVGIHGLGEGWDFGHTAYATSSADLLNAFGGVMAGVAYVLHKALEPMMVGACYVHYTKGQARNGARWIRDLFLLSIAFIFASLVGAVGGYFVSFDTTYFFALGTGTSIYAAFRLVGPLFIPSQTVRSKDTVAIAIALLLGFIAIYIAALFHS
jgi:hypothetical protein